MFGYITAVFIIETLTEAEDRHLGPSVPKSSLLERLAFSFTSFFRTLTSVDVGSVTAQLWADARLSTMLIPK